ncbi:MAG: hypothetical protein WD810_01010, partial [Solirubrobacterales bacterium]
MVKRALPIVLLALAGCAVAAPGAAADGASITASASGVTLSGSQYRYVALSPGRRHRVTVVARIDLKGGRVGRWWYLPGGYYVPAVAYDRSAGGLSADGRTLVLTQLPRAFPPKATRFAVLDTDLHLRHPRRAGQRRPPGAVTRVDLDGDFSFDAISPDGSTIYLIHNLHPPGRPAGYEVRALDTASWRLLPKPIVDPDEPDERMQGLPITRTSSADGRWAYTLYDGNGKEPFIHALDTVGGRAVCVDLPQLEDRRDPFLLFLLKMRLAQAGRELVVFSRSPGQGNPPSPPLLGVDTRTFAVHRPAPAAGAPRGGGGGGGVGVGG